MATQRQQIGAGRKESCPAPSSSPAPSLDAVIAGLADLDADQLRLQWRNHLGGAPPAHLPRWLLARVLAQRMQAAALGDLDKATLRIIRQAKGGGEDSDSRPFAPRDPATRDGVGLKAGALLVREWNGALQRVMVLEKGFAWNGKTYGSLSQIAKAMTGTSWNGHRFFGLRPANGSVGAKAKSCGDSDAGPIAVSTAIAPQGSRATAIESAGLEEEARVDGRPTADAQPSLVGNASRVRRISCRPGCGVAAASPAPELPIRARGKVRRRTVGSS
jgi:hypothetical protein